jgi:phosphoribosyl-ATP pyrophosphohydrolase/phosphoribosyl-AMP cyclohydrolase
MKLCRKDEARKFADSIGYLKEGLVPVVVCDANSGELLMQAYASREAIVKTLTSGFAWFYSRSRERLWKKGETSWNVMRVEGVGIDCDNDAVLYEVAVLGERNACHLNRKSCFERKFGVGSERLTIAKLAEVIDGRAENPDKKSYTVKLLRHRRLACAKVSEEAAELVEAIGKKPKKEVVWEACDLIYHALVATRGRGVLLSELETEFAKRNRKNNAKR